jgi:hypothetical protein
MIPATPSGELLIDTDGWCTAARRVESPNCDERPEGAPVSLVVLHSISLPPGDFGGPWIEDLFTNRLDPAAHPYFRRHRAAQGVGAFSGAAQRRTAAVRADRQTRVARRCVELAGPRTLQ